jgi:hypothetical protein
MTDDTPPDSDDIARIRRSRNTVLGLLLGAFVILVFFISLAKMG